MNKKELYIVIFFVFCTSFAPSCASTKDTENCTIKKVLIVNTKNDSLYSMKVKFSSFSSEEVRKTLIKEEFQNRFPLLHDKTINVKEYIGKMAREYWYDITVELE